MKSLLLEATHNSPFVSLNAETLEFTISGDSRPENSQNLFDPLINWLSEFKTYAASELTEGKLNLVIALDYFNSSSAKCLFDFIEKFAELEEIGLKVKVIWQYEFDDDDVFDAGQDLAEMLGIEFEFLPIGA